MKRIPPHITWPAFVLAFAAFDLQLRQRSGQVQGKLIKYARHTNAMVATNNSSWNGRSAEASEVDNNYFQAPNDMQTLTNPTNHRRFMLSDMYDTLESLVRSIARGIHPMKKTVILYEDQFTTRHQYMPTGTTIAKNVAKSPPKWIKARRHPFLMNYPPTKPKWLSSSITPISDVTNNNYNNYKMLEELALLEWEKKQKNSSTVINSANGSASNLTLNLIGTVISDSSENWKPIEVGPPKLATAESQKARPYDVTEPIPEESGHTSRWHNGTSAHSLPIKYGRLHSEFQVNSTEKKQARTSNINENESYINTERNFTKSKVLHKETHLGRTATATPITFYLSTEASLYSRRNRGALQFGDKL